ncbi:hypothetical protein [Cohnella sp. WQ 127256]|uniref:hypothetical protein n=1 Tax=Cohnella sp. WQ 127256 TaxID=2938790 RepID=UPI002118E34A|nr:hypothetical protein [Cohnella sp. WQ 127256]
MKRVMGLVVFLCLLLNSNVTVHAAQQTAGWKQAYKTKILNYIHSDNWGQDSEIALFDIDRDGVPELFTGSSYRLSNHIATAYSFKKEKIQTLTLKGPGQSEAGKLGFADFQLFKEKKTGKYRVIARDCISGASNGTCGEYIVQLAGATLTTTEISTHTQSDESGDSYTFLGKKITKAQYDAKQKNYYAQLTNMQMKTTKLSGNPDMLDATQAYYDLAVNKYLQIDSTDKKKIYSSASAFIKEYNKPKEVFDQMTIDQYTIKKVDGSDTLVANLYNGTLTGAINADKSLRSITVRQKMAFPTQQEIKEADEAGMSATLDARMGHILISTGILYTLDPKGIDADTSKIQDWIRDLPNNKSSKALSQKFIINGFVYNMIVKDGFFNLTVTRA